MPKQSGKINSAEREICVRLKLFRESIGWRQQDFSDRLGISLNQYVGIEYARTPLKYGTAWKVREVFGLSLAWIANGKYPPNEPDLDPWPSPATISNESALFSEISDSLRFQDLNSPAHKERQKVWFEEHRKRVPFKPGRSVILAVLQDNLVEWMARIPERNVQDFATEIIQCGQSYADKFSSDPATKIDVRTRALIWGEMREEVNKRLLQKHSPLSGKGRLDKKNASASVSNMRAEVPTWPELKKDIKRLTAQRGEKKALADKIGVSRQALGNWLSDDSQGTPNAALTLELLQWVRSRPSKK